MALSFEVLPIYSTKKELQQMLQLFFSGITVTQPEKALALLPPANLFELPGKGCYVIPEPSHIFSSCGVVTHAIRIILRVK